MGDKSPKSKSKLTNQKKTKSNDVAQKKSQAEASKQRAPVKK